MCYILWQVFNGVDLAKEPGWSPTIFSRNVIRKMYKDEEFNLVLTDRGKRTPFSPLEPMPLELVQALQSKIKTI